MADLAAAAPLVIFGHALAGLVLAWLYFRRAAITRPPIGVMGLSDVAFMVATVIVTPLLYGVPVAMEQKITVDSVRGSDAIGSALPARSAHFEMFQGLADDEGTACSESCVRGSGQPSWDFLAFISLSQKH